MKLTNDTVRTLPDGPKGDMLYPDADQRAGVPGLYLRVRSSGSRTFVIQWRQGQFQRRSTIGKVGVLSLDEARKAARKALVGIDEGNDPVAAKAKSRADSSLIFETVAKDYLDARKKDLKPGSFDQCQRHLLKYFKGLHRMAIGKIDRATVAVELRGIAKNSGPVQADRARSTLSKFFGWCIGEGFLETNPVIGTNKHSNSKGRERVLAEWELVLIWQAAPASDYGRIVRLLMLTAQRRNEISDLSWAELITEPASDAVIELPASRTKNGRPHLVPLSAQALAVLGECVERDGRAFLFGEGRRGFNGFSRAKEALDAAIAKLLPEGKEMAPWTLHDLRRTADTMMAEKLKVLPHVTEAILNHVSSIKSGKAGVAGVYNKATYLDEKRAALDLWGAHLQLLLAKAAGANVTVLKRA